MFTACRATGADDARRARDRQPCTQADRKGAGIHARRRSATFASTSFWACPPTPARRPTG